MYASSIKQQTSISSTSFLLEQKIMNSFFTKHYVRANVLGNSSTKLLDNNQSFVNFTLEEINKKCFDLKTSTETIGKSIALDSFTFKNKRNNTVQINSFLEHKQFQHQNEMGNLTFWLDSLQKYKSKKRASCAILRSVKGGFFCYSGGIKGFLPRRQTLRAFFRTFFHFFEHNDKKKLSNLNFLTNKKHSFYSNGALKLPILLGKTNLATRSKYKNFSYVFHKKRLGVVKSKPMNFLNFVFLTYLKKSKIKLGDSNSKNFAQTLPLSEKSSKSITKKITINSLKKIYLKK
jgi:hypothetical protein